MVPFIITSDAITVVLEGKSRVVYKSNQYYETVKTALKSRDLNKIRNAVDLASAINNFGKGKVYVKDGQVYYNSKVVDNVISDHIIRMINEGFNVDPMLAFLRNLMNNPSETSREELYLFMQKGKMPITDDGCFLAYKRVRNDYTDVHSGKFDNSPGKTVEMKREDVDTNRNNTCSRGLHFCSESYLPHFSPGSKVVLVKINPADVVSIPVDYANAKGRTWRYVVLKDVTDKVGEYTQAVYQDDTEDSDADVGVVSSVVTTNAAVSKPVVSVPVVATTVPYHSVRDKFGKFVKASSKRRVN